MKILVTGGAGYVGSVLVPELLNKGYEVRVLDSLMYGQLSLLPCFINTNFEFLRGDIRNQEAVKKAVDGADCVIHLAAIVGAPACRRDERLAWEVNYEGTVNLDEARDSTQGIVFASTGSVYGTVEGICTEETPPKALSLYGESKMKSEHRLRESGNVVVYRFGTGFGLSPRLRMDLLVNDFAYQALKNRFILLYEKHFRRTFIHVRDMAASLIHAVENFDGMKDEVYNVGDEKLNYTKEELALAIKEKIDFQLYFADIGTDFDKRDYELSYKKIRSAGFQTSISLEEGIEELLKGCQMVSLRNPYSNV